MVGPAGQVQPLDYAGTDDVRSQRPMRVLVPRLGPNPARVNGFRQFVTKGFVFASDTQTADGGAWFCVTLIIAAMTLR
jgi:hypothetical protein